jgi:hypothetical protein
MLAIMHVAHRFSGINGPLVTLCSRYLRPREQLCELAPAPGPAARKVQRPPAAVMMCWTARIWMVR